MTQIARLANLGGVFALPDWPWPDWIRNLANHIQFGSKSRLVPDCIAEIDARSNWLGQPKPLQLKLI